MSAKKIRELLTIILDSTFGTDKWRDLSPATRLKNFIIKRGLIVTHHLNLKYKKIYEISYLC